MAVVTDIVFLRKRANGQTPNHVDREWLGVAPMAIDGADIAINSYFHHHPEMVLGDWTRKDTLYGGDDGYSLKSNGNLATQLASAIGRLPEFAPLEATAANDEPPPRFVPPPLERHIGESSFFIGDDRIIHQMEHGQAPEPVTYCGVLLKADGTPNASIDRGG